jgi:hypothetical protein
VDRAGGGRAGLRTALNFLAKGWALGIFPEGTPRTGEGSREAKSGTVLLAVVVSTDWVDGTIARRTGQVTELGKLLDPIADRMVITAVPFLLPLKSHWQRGYFGAGVALYDTLCGRSSLPRHRHVGRTGLRTLAPGLEATRFVGGIRYFDAQVDDSRFTLALARTADGWRLDGGKLWIHNAPVCDFAVVLARTDPERRAAGGARRRHRGPHGVRRHAAREPPGDPGGDRGVHGPPDRKPGCPGAKRRRAFHRGLCECHPPRLRRSCRACGSATRYESAHSRR